MDSQGLGITKIWMRADQVSSIADLPWPEGRLLAAGWVLMRADEGSRQQIVWEMILNVLDGGGVVAESSAGETLPETAGRLAQTRWPRGGLRGDSKPKQLPTMVMTRKRLQRVLVGVGKRKLPCGMRVNLPAGLPSRGASRQSPSPGWR